MYHLLSQTPLGKQWSRIGTDKKAGVIFPLFSIFSKDSIGIGEIPDLRLVIDWCKLTDNKILQILPINDTGGAPSPFSPQTSIGLNPIYLSINHLKGIKIEEKEILRIKKRFPNKGLVRYKLWKEKIKLLKSSFNESVISSEEFNEFINQNDYWLNDYALFRSIKSKNKEKVWEKWDKKIRDREPESILHFKQNNKKEILFWKWIQWELFEQFKEIKEYAQDKKILIKGDLPLLVSGDSVDCWANKLYFKMDLASGAIPDSFSKRGQRWGMPPYDWDKIIEDDFQYLKERLRYAEKIYDLFRIDHFVGLFRIWSIPQRSLKIFKGARGFFDPKDESDQEKRGKEILKLIIENTTMLPCAEDLGTVPHFCRKIMEDFGILGIDTKRWTKEFRPMAISTLSTHDTSLSPEWEKENVDIKDNLTSINASVCIFSIPLIFEWLFLGNIIKKEKARSYRVNIPGKKSKRNWAIRLPLSMEELLIHSINSHIKTIIKDSGRS